MSAKSVVIDGVEYVPKGKDLQFTVGDTVLIPGTITAAEVRLEDTHPYCVETSQGHQLWFRESDLLAFQGESKSG